MIELLAACFARVAAHREEAGSVFYARLFTTAPELKPVFKGPFESQTDKLVGMLAQIVEYYRVGVDPQSQLARLGQNQATYGGRRAEFDAVGDALLFTLAQVLGHDFTAEVRAVWATAYAEVSAAMIRLSDAAVPSVRPYPASARL